MVAGRLLLAGTDDFSKVFRAFTQQLDEGLPGPEGSCVFGGGNNDDRRLSVFGDGLRTAFEGQLHHFAESVLGILKLPALGNHGETQHFASSLSSQFIKKTFPKPPATRAAK